MKNPIDPIVRSSVITTPTALLINEIISATLVGVGSIFSYPHALNEVQELVRITNAQSVPDVADTTALNKVVRTLASVTPTANDVLQNLPTKKPENKNPYIS